jgi:hypothetical protein
MGMFDWIAFEIDCPKCGKRVKGFQSKDHDCKLQVLLPHMVRRMYSSCDDCDIAIEFMDGKQVEPMYEGALGDTLPMRYHRLTPTPPAKEQ